jgi:ribosomal protein L44E
MTTLKTRYGRVFEFVERWHQPHVRKDGKPTALVTWSFTCPKCKASYFISTSRSGRGLDRAECDCPRTHPWQR